MTGLGEARDQITSGPAQPHDGSNPTLGADIASDHVATTDKTPPVRQYLDLHRLSRLWLPHHPCYSNEASDHSVSLVQFFNNLFTEIQRIDFDEGFREQGTWCPKDGHVLMPPLVFRGDSKQGQAMPVPVSVERRIKPMNKAMWLARSSTHCGAHVELSELGELLSQDHSRNEAVYTPSVYDANELLSWEGEELLKALRSSNYRDKFQAVEMAVFQMFHVMPKVIGFNLLQDRVFHVLVVTARSYHAESPAELSHSFTVQLPVDYDSFSDVAIVQRRSHAKKTASSQCYHFPSDADSPRSRPGAVEQKHQGKKLTEGTYVSLERLLGAPKALSVHDDTRRQTNSANDNHHRWDMMTLSTAEGMTRKAPEQIQQKETLVAIAKDVEYVLKHIAKQRQDRLDRAKTGE
ncbi:hypothetical protein BDW02DRAFT_488663 [Decorospora gaudefroyi]|uniref:DUF3074 domain-containing protein n=1 Tax=Decorospora gaudefroyi TaxID=184978 RepID=A0A6A5KR53_9PLEO|nr:hypothetical protein BDW02DRAFT_488663 [Decorospora gaudefroyi]